MEKAADLVGRFFRCSIYTGNGKTVSVIAKVIEVIDKAYVKIEFPHPSVRRFTASRIYPISSLERING